MSDPLPQAPVLVAGFSSFPGAPRNPTEDLVRSLQDEAAVGPGFAATVLPVAWEASWPALRTAIEAVRPRAVLLFGLHMRAERMRVELVARNRRELGRADAVGDFPSGPAVLDGPERLAARLDWSGVAAVLREAGIAFEWSTNAGGYLCNATLYRLAHEAGRLGVSSFGFFHVPLTDETVAETVAAQEMPEVFCSLPAAALRRAAKGLVALHAEAAS